MKLIKYCGWVAVAVVIVELGLSMSFTPVAPQSVLGIMIFGSFAIALVVAVLLFVFVFFLRDRQRERTAFTQLAQQSAQDSRHALDRASDDHRYALDTVVTISQKQARTIAAAIAMGAELVQLPSGQYGARMNGQTALLSEAEAAHFYDLSQD